MNKSYITQGDRQRRICPSPFFVETICPGFIVRRSLMDNTLKYAMKLAFLNQLYGKKLITDKEYNVIKSDLMKKHKIVSEQ